MEPYHLQVLTDRVHGLFVWSSTVRNHVENAFDCNIALKRIMDQMESPANRLFSALDRLYQCVLKEAIGDVTTNDDEQAFNQYTLNRALGVSLIY